MSETKVDIFMRRMVNLPLGTYMVIVDIGPAGPTMGSLTPLGRFENWQPDSD